MVAPVTNAAAHSAGSPSRSRIQSSAIFSQLEAAGVTESKAAF